MKRVLLAAILVLLVSSFAFATEGDMVFMWRPSDPAINYFRYSVDGADWIVVGNDQRDSIFSYEKDQDHYFSISQSYDGVLWSEPVDVVFSSAPEEAIQKKKNYSRFITSVNFVPFETYIATRAHKNSREYQSIYAAGLEMSAVGFPLERFGCGAAVEGTYAYIGAYSRNSSLNWSAYGLFAYRFVSHPKFDVIAEIGLGAQFESLDGKIYISPSALLEVDASMKVYENLSVSISPSVSVSYSDFDWESDYLAYNIRAISIGMKYSI